MARFFIWICRSKENIPKIERFILHLRHYKKEIVPYSIDKLLLFQLSTRDSAKTILSTECLLFFCFFFCLKYYSLEFDLIFSQSIKFQCVLLSFLLVFFSIVIMNERKCTAIYTVNCKQTVVIIIKTGQ